MAKQKQDNTDTPWFSGLSELPFNVPSKAAIKEEGDPREKVGVVYKGWNFKLFDMHNPDDVKGYEGLRDKLTQLLRFKQVSIAKDGAQLIQRADGQHLYYVLEWTEFEAAIYKDEDGVPVKQTHSDDTNNKPEAAAEPAPQEEQQEEVKPNE